MNKKQTNQITVRYHKVIYAPVGNIFPLICPVREEEWIPGWKYTLLHCPRMRNEKGTVFLETSSSVVLAGGIGKATTWTTEVYDPENLIIRFRLNNTISESIYTLNLSEKEAGKSILELVFRYTAINRKGKKNIKNGAAEKITLMLSYLIRLLKYYCEHNQRMSAKEAARLLMNSSTLKHLRITDHLKLLCNNLIVKHSKQ